MLLREQAWALMVEGVPIEKVAQRMNRTEKVISSYLWNERRALGLDAYPFILRVKPPTFQAKAWALAKEGVGKRKIATLMNTSLERVNVYLREERIRLGYKEFPFPVKHVREHHQRLGNIYHPEVNHRQLFKELAH